MVEPVVSPVEASKPNREARIIDTFTNITEEREVLNKRLQVLNFKEAVGKFELIIDEQQKNNISHFNLDKKMIPASDGKFVLLRYNAGFEVISFDKNEFPKGYNYNITPSASNLFRFITDQSGVPVSLQIYDTKAFEPGTDSIYNHPLGKEIPLDDESISTAFGNNSPLNEFISMMNNIKPLKNSVVKK